jgi:hypothetical protein
MFQVFRSNFRLSALIIRLPINLLRVNWIGVHLHVTIVAIAKINDSMCEFCNSCIVGVDNTGYVKISVNV